MAMRTLRARNPQIRDSLSTMLSRQYNCQEYQRMPRRIQTPFWASEKRLGYRWNSACSGSPRTTSLQLAWSTQVWPASRFLPPQAVFGLSSSAPYLALNSSVLESSLEFWLRWLVSFSYPQWTWQETMTTIAGHFLTNRHNRLQSAMLWHLLVQCCMGCMRL